MSWKKISDSQDLKIFEKSKNKLKIRIEARLTEKGWEIYKNYNDGDKGRLIEEYMVETEREVNDLLESLKKEQDLTEKDIGLINKWKSSQHRFEYKRIYKGVDSEKWSISVNNGTENFVIIKFGDNLVIDLLLNEKYKFISEKILNDVYKTLIDDDEAEKITENIFYFNKSTINREENPRHVYVNNIELSFGVDPNI